MKRYPFRAFVTVVISGGFMGALIATVWGVVLALPNPTPVTFAGAWACTIVAVTYVCNVVHAAWRGEL